MRRRLSYPTSWREQVSQGKYRARWNAVRLAALRRDEWRCQLCRGYGNEADHIRPLHRGGEPFRLRKYPNTLLEMSYQGWPRPRDPAWTKKLKALMQS